MLFSLLKGLPCHLTINLLFGTVGRNLQTHESRLQIMSAVLLVIYDNLHIL
jgi:hypothetical protein